MHVYLRHKKQECFYCKSPIIIQRTKADKINLSFLWLLRKPRLAYVGTPTLGFRKKSTHLGRSQ